MHSVCSAHASAARHEEGVLGAPPAFSTPSPSLAAAVRCCQCDAARPARNKMSEMREMSFVQQLVAARNAQLAAEAAAAVDASAADEVRAQRATVRCAVGAACAARRGKLGTRRGARQAMVIDDAPQSKRPRVDAGAQHTLGGGQKVERLSASSAARVAPQPPPRRGLGLSEAAGEAAVRRSLQNLSVSHQVRGLRVWRTARRCQNPVSALTRCVPEQPPAAVTAVAPHHMLPRASPPRRTPRGYETAAGDDGDDDEDASYVRT
jgi:hypothetical protein